MKIYTKESLIERIQEIADMGWIENTKRVGNDGAIGNLMEDLLGIEENNLPIPNAAEWEMKCGRFNSSSLTTLFHLEPSPQALRFVPAILLPHYGWKHQQAGKRHTPDTKSFRITFHSQKRTDRGFLVVVDRNEQKIKISFDASCVDPRHQAWLEDVEQNIGLGELDPQPYWGFEDLSFKAGTKLKNMFYIQADRKREKGQEFFFYRKAQILRGFAPYKFIDAIEAGNVYVDFDARTGKNHGTKFRLRRDDLPDLYADVTTIVDLPPV